MWIVVVIAIALIAWCYFGTTSPAVAPVTAPLSENQPGGNQGLLAASSAAVSSTPESGLTTSPSDDSNAALNSDMSVLSSQSSAMDQDSAAANQSASAQ